MFHVTVLPGDGIGPEIIESAINVLKVAAIKYNIEIHFTSYDFGGISIDRHGVPVTSQVLDACIHSDAVLLGAVGGPAWDCQEPALRPGSCTSASSKRNAGICKSAPREAL